MLGSRPIRVLVFLAGLLGALALTRSAEAYSWMIKHGFSRCSTCHTDPSGGEILNGMGRAASERLLSFGGEDAQEVSDSSQFLFGLLEEPDGFQLGGSYRHLLVNKAPFQSEPGSTVHFPMQVDTYGSARFGRLVFSASVGVAKGVDGTAHARGAQINSEDGDGWLLLSRSHYVGLWLQKQTLVRAGRINLPFGVRVPEHVLWAREATRTDRESDQQHGVALSHEQGRLRLEGMFILGNFQLNPDRFRERGLSATMEYLLSPTLAVGGSGLFTIAQVDRLTSLDDSSRYAVAGHARAGLGNKVAALAEVSLLGETQRGLGMTGFVQLDYEPWRGLHVQLTGEALDRGLPEGGTAVPGAGSMRYGGWGSVVAYPWPHIELRLDVVARQQEARTIQAQLHIYL